MEKEKILKMNRRKLTRFVTGMSKEVLTAVFMYGMGASVVVLLFRYGWLSKIAGAVLAIIIILLLIMPDEPTTS